MTDAAETDAWAFVSGRYRMVDLDFGIRSDDAPTARFLDRLLAPFREDGDPQRWYELTTTVDDGLPRVVVLLDGRRVLQPRPLGFIGLFLWHLNQRVMLDTRSALAIHAAVVARAGHAVVIPGGPDAGKSTLAAALVNAGFDFMSDEAALLRPDDAAVVPYRRWLSVQAGSWPLLPWLRPPPDPAYEHEARGQWLIPAAELSADPGPCPAVAFVFPRQTPGTPARLVARSRAETVRDLARHTTNLGPLGVPGFEALVGACSRATCWDLELDGLEAAVATIDRLVTKGA